MDIAFVIFVVLATTALTTLWLFTVVHMVQRVDDPLERTKWMLLFILLNVIAVVLYRLTIYRQLQAEGKGHLIRKKAPLTGDSVR